MLIAGIEFTSWVYENRAAEAYAVAYAPSDGIILTTH